MAGAKCDKWLCGHSKLYYITVFHERWLILSLLCTSVPYNIIEDCVIIQEMSRVFFVLFGILEFWWEEKG